MMAYDKNWEKFKKTGKIEDYLKFKKTLKPLRLFCAK